MSEVNETTEMWAEYKTERQEKRKKNRITSAQILADHDVTFSSSNAGAHLIVQGRNDVIDFWPGTGKYITRGGKKGRGVFSLLRLCDQKIRKL